MERRQFIQHQAKSFVNKILYRKVEMGNKINGRRINQGNKSNCKKNAKVFRERKLRHDLETLTIPKPCNSSTQKGRRGDLSLTKGWF